MSETPHLDKFHADAKAAAAKEASPIGLAHLSLAVADCSKKFPQIAQELERHLASQAAKTPAKKQKQQSTRKAAGGRSKSR